MGERTTQVVIEYPWTEASEAAATQVVIEYPWTPPSAARVTQCCIEVLIGDPNPPAPPPTTTVETIRRLRRFPHLSQEQTRLFFSRLQLDLQAGVGTSTGQGQDPQIMLRMSKDGGFTWGPERWVSAGKIGEYSRRAIWNRLGSGRDVVFEISMSDPVLWAILDAYLDVDQGTR